MGVHFSSLILQCPHTTTTTHRPHGQPPHHTTGVATTHQATYTATNNHQRHRHQPAPNDHMPATPSGPGDEKSGRTRGVGV